MMNKPILITGVLLLTLACTDNSEEISSITEEKAEIIDTIATDSTTFLLFKGIWEVQRYTSNVCETTSDDCHKVTLNNDEQPLYIQYEFLPEEIIATGSNQKKEYFDVSYLDPNLLIFENNATRSNQWDGTQEIEWINDEEIIMTNYFYSADSTFIFTDIFDLKR